MNLPSLHAPAELHRKSVAPETVSDDPDVVVARGPFIILACGFMALERTDRDSLWIECDDATLSSEQIEEAVRRWRQPPYRRDY